MWGFPGQQQGSIFFSNKEKFPVARNQNMSKAFRAGYNAYVRDGFAAKNPYNQSTSPKDFADWEEGQNAALIDEER